MFLKQILEKIASVDSVIKFFGATEEFKTEYRRLCKKIGDAVCKEKGITRKEAIKLSPETVVYSKEVIDSFDELCKWLPKQDPDFS